MSVRAQSKSAKKGKPGNTMNLALKQDFIFFCEQKQLQKLNELDVFGRHFYFVRGHSLIELTEHTSSAADIMVHIVYIYVPLRS